VGKCYAFTWGIMDKTPLATSGKGKYKLHSRASISMQRMYAEKLTWLFLALGGKV